MRQTLIIFSFVLGALFSPSIFAKDAKVRGLEIAKEMEEKNDDFIGSRSKMEMVLIDAYGTKTVRQMLGSVLEVDGDGDRSLIEFLNPKDVKGTKMLTWTHKTEDDDQWLYLPSFRRVKRISSSNKSASFMGSEFSFEDLGSQEVEKYSYKFLRDDKVDGKDVWVLQRIPKGNSGYSKQISFVRKDIYNPTKVEYYDRKGELLKVATFNDYKKHKVGDKTLYRASSIHMKNVQTKKESIFSWFERKLGVNLSARKFKKSALK